jgi:hypothetical protein
MRTLRGSARNKEVKITNLERPVLVGPGATPAGLAHL